MPVKLNGSTSGYTQIQANATAGNNTLTLPTVDAATIIATTAVSSSTTNTVTNKLAISVNGTTYYLLASTSGT